MKNNRIGLTVMLLVCLLLMTGCWDEQEIEHRTMVLTLGFDRLDDGRFVAMIEASSPEARGSGATGGTNAVQATTSYFMKATGGSPWEALVALDSRTSRKLWLGETQAIVFGTKMAAAGVDAALDMLKHQGTVDRQGKMVLAENPEEVLSLRTMQERDSASYIEAVYGRSNPARSLTDAVPLWDFYRRVANPQSFAVLPLVWAGQNELDFRGLGLFNGTKLTGFLSAAETQAYLFTQGRASDGLFVVHLPDALDGKPVEITVRLFNKRHRIRLLGDAQEPHGQIEVILRADISNQSSLDYLFTLKDREPLLRAIEDEYRSDLQSAIKTAREAGSDIFGFGELYRARHYYDWVSREDWVKRFRTMPIDINIRAVLGDVGPSQ